MADQSNILLQGFKLLAALIPSAAPVDEPKFEGHYKENIAPKEIEFLPPDGFQLPPGTDPDAKFTAVATLRLKSGKMCLLEIDGSPVYDDEPDEVDDHDNVFLESLKQRLPPSGMPD